MAFVKICRLEDLLILGLIFLLLHTTPAGQRDVNIKNCHDDDRQVEGGDGRAEGNHRVGEELDVALTLRDCAFPNNELPEEDSWSPKYEREDPGCCNH